jgi:phosphoglycerate dehydrogenase-like enzyme
MSKLGLTLCTLAWSEAHIQRLRDGLKNGLGAERFVYTRDADEIGRLIPEAEVALISGSIDARHLASPSLRWVHCDAAGLDGSARPEVFERGLKVTSSSGRTSPALAEHAIFFMLSFCYRVRELIEAQAKHQWGLENQGRGRGLVGQTVGIVGLGNTGRELATRCKAFGMRVLGHRRRAEAVPGVDVLTATDRGESIDGLLRESDFVVLATPLSDSTHHLIGARELALMKPSAVIVNMARGSVIDELALIEALRENRIRGAGLDVFAKEPLPADSPLWDLPNVLITPHATPSVADRDGNSLNIVLENARRYLAGQPMVNLLTTEDLYTRRG